MKSKAMEASPLPLRRESILLLGVLFSGYAVYSTDRTVLSVVLKPMVEGLGLSNLQTGVLASAQFIGVALVVFAAGALSDRYGARRIVLLGVGVFTAFTWLVAFSGDFYQAFAFRLVSGIGEGLFWPVAMAWVADAFGARKGMALGVFYVGFDVGQIVGDVIGASAFAATGDWRTPFLVAPLLGVGVIAGLFFVGHPGPEARMAGRVALGREAVGLAKKGRTILIMAFALLATWAALWQVVFLPFYYSNVFGITVAEAGLVSILLPAAGAAGKVVLGDLSDYLRRDRVLAGVSLAVVGVYAVFFSAPSLAVAAVASVAMGFVGASVFPIVQSMMAESSGGLTGTGLGLTTSAQSVATVFAPTITGYLLYLGVGRAVALDAIAPAAGMLAVALLIGRWKDDVAGLHA